MSDHCGRGDGLSQIAGLSGLRWRRAPRRGARERTDPSKEDRHDRPCLGAGRPTARRRDVESAVPLRPGPEPARKVLDDIQAAPIAKPDVDEKWIMVPASVGDVKVRIVKPLGADGLRADRAVHPRRRLGPRQRRHPRSARTRVGRARPGRRRLRRVRPIARGPVPRRHRAGLRHRPVDHRHGITEGLDHPASPSPATPSAATWPPP